MNEIVREELNLTEEEAREIVYRDSEYFDVILDTITDTELDRWSTYHEIIVKRIDDNKYFRSTYSVGDEAPYENEHPLFTEVFPVEKTIIVYE